MTLVHRTWRPALVLGVLFAATIVALFILVAISAGLVFHVTTVALPKIVDERLGLSVSLMQVGGIATLILPSGPNFTPRGLDIVLRLARPPSGPVASLTWTATWQPERRGKHNRQRRIAN